MARIADLIAAGRTFSFEFFPPKSDMAQLTLGRTISELESLSPSFVSITYGAGGSTRQRTQQLVQWIRQETTINPMAHLTCQGHRRSEIAEILDTYAAADVQNILALGGDAPADGSAEPSDYSYAADLLDDALHDILFVRLRVFPPVAIPDGHTDCDGEEELVHEHPG